MASHQPISFDRPHLFSKANVRARLDLCLAWWAKKPVLIFLAWSFWLSAEYLIFGSSSYVRVHDNGDATLPMLLAHAPPKGLPWNPLALCGLDGLACGFQLTNIVFLLLPGWLAYGLFMWLQRFIAGYFMHRLLKDTLKLSLLPGLFAGIVYSQFSQPSNNASWAGFTLYDTLGLPGLPLLIWLLYHLMKSAGWWWLPGGLLLGMAFGISSPYAFAPFIMLACISWAFIAPPEKPLRLLVLAGLLVIGCAVINFPTLWASSLNAPLSHRAAWKPNPALARNWIGNLLFGWGFVADNALPLAMAGIGWYLSSKQNRRLKILAGFLALSVIFVVGYEPLMAVVQGHLGFLAGFQFSRVYLIIPFLAAAAGAMGLESISSEWRLSATNEDRQRWTITLPVALFTVATVLLLWQSLSIKKRTLTELAGGANYSTLYQNPELIELAETTKSQKPFRVATVTSQNNPALQPGLAWAYGLETVDGYANLYPKRYQDYWESVIGALIKADQDRYDYFHFWGNRVYLFAPTGGFPDGPPVRFNDYYRLELLSLANARYIISSRPLDDKRLSLLPSSIRDSQLKWASQSKSQKMLSLLRGENPGMPLYIYENQEVLPRYFLVSQVKIFEDKAKLLAGLDTATLTELESTVYLDKTEATNMPASQPVTGAGSVSIVNQSSDVIELTVTNSSNTVLVAANLYSPFWKAVVDGKSTRVFPADDAFQGISLEAGDHRVELRYQPPYYFKP